MVVWMKKQRGGRALGMRIREARKIHVQHRVAIRHNEAIRQMLEGIEYCARGTKRFGFANTTNTIAEALFDVLRSETGQNENVVETVALCEVDLMFEQGLAADFG